MQIITMDQQQLTPGADCKALQTGDWLFQLSKEGAGIHLPQLIDCPERYLVFHVKVCEDHSLSMTLLVYVHGEEEPAFTLRFGLLLRVDTTVCIDLNWLNGHELFPEALPGGLKMVCHGRRVLREEMVDVVLVSMPCHHDVALRFHDMELTDEFPSVQLPEVKLIDSFGQAKQKEWAGKTRSLDELREKLSRQLSEKHQSYPYSDWSSYGGWKQKKLTEETGYFSRCKHNGRW